VKIRSGNGFANEVIFDGDVKGEGMTIMLSAEDPLTAVTWRIEVYVQLAQGWWFLGFFLTNTAAVDNAAARVVGFASCPGAKGWKVIARNTFPGSNDGFDHELFIQPGLCCGGGMPAGVFVPPQPPGSGGAGGGV